MRNNFTNYLSYCTKIFSWVVWGLLLLALCTGSVYAQNRSISGKVSSAETGNALPGVNVIVKGTTLGTVTDVDGNYRLDVPSDANTITFSFIGLKAQEVDINGQSTINVQMAEDAQQLSEVIITGYNTVKRSDLTSAISTVDGEKIQSQPVASIDNLLQGTSPGVLVTNQNGAPGGNAYIRIRGVGSYNASNEPLFIIDGVQMTQQDYNAINPNDIKSITVLKDAASTSIYGARASNGVVLITTKRGNANRGPQVSYKFQYGNKEIIPLNFDLMNKEQKLRYEVELGVRTQAEADALSNDPSAPDTNWLDVLLRTGQVQTHDVSVSGGGETSNYFVSLNYYDEDGISKGSDFNRFTGRLNTDFTTSKWLKFGNSFSLSQTKTNEVRDRYNVQNPFFAAIAYNPYEPEYVLDGTGNIVRDENGEPEYNLTRQGFSISEAIKNNPEMLRRTHLIGNVYATVTPIENLAVTSRLGGNYDIYRREYYIMPGSVLDTYIGDPNAPGIKTDNGADRFIFNWTNTANYDLTVADVHHLGFLVGTEFIKFDDQSIEISAKGFPSRKFGTLDNAAEITGGNTIREQWSLWSQFAEARYNFNEKYIFTASARRDGSSRFGADKKYGIFWSGSAAWNVAEEDFMGGISNLDQLKLRAAVGTSGNVPGSNDLYASLGLYGFGNYNSQTAAFPFQLANQDLQWESNFNYSVGVDFGLFQKLSGSIDYYSRTTSNLLFDRPLSRTVGFSSRLENVGEILNNGIEVELRGDVIKKNDLKLTLFGGVATNHNEVKSLENEGEDIINEFSGVSILREGLAINTFYLPRYAGVDPQTGDALYYDTDGETTSEYSGDYAVALEGKAPQPTYFGNLGFDLNFKGIGLNTNFYYQGGNYIYNFAYEAVLLSDGYDALASQRVDAFNYWKEPGDTGVLPKPDLTNDLNDSDRYLQKGDFIRLRNVMLSYDLPQTLMNRIGLQNFRVFLQGTNLWTYNPHVSGDPEVGKGSEETDLELAGEFTLFTYPNTRGYTFGVNVTF